MNGVQGKRACSAGRINEVHSVVLVVRGVKGAGREAEGGGREARGEDVDTGTCDALQSRLRRNWEGGVEAEGRRDAGGVRAMAEAGGNSGVKNIERAPDGSGVPGAYSVSMPSLARSWSKCSRELNWMVMAPAPFFRAGRTAVFIPSCRLIWSARSVR